MKNKAFLILSIFIILASNNQCTNSLRILGLFPVQEKSHFTLCETMMKGLAERGHQVDVFSHFPQKKIIPNYKDFSLAGSLPAVVNNLTYEQFQPFRKMDMKVIIQIFGNPVCELMDLPVFQELFRSLKKNQPYDVVVIETFMANCYLAWGSFLNVPMVGIVPSQFLDMHNDPLGNPFNPAVTPGLWSGLAYPMNFFERLTNIFTYYTKNFEFNYFVSDQNKYVERLFGPGYPDASELTKDLDLLLVNGHHSIEGARAYPPAVVPVAGLHVVDDGEKLKKDVQRWLDESEAGCIYVSFGSMVRIETFPKPVLEAFYAAFRKLAPVRFLVKIAKPEELPPGLPPNVMTQSWCNQIQVLKHKNLKIFLTHGGYGSVLESVYAGVPLIGIPLFGDQSTNVKTQVNRKAAVMINLYDITEEAITTAIKEILNNPIYKENAERNSRKIIDQPMNPMDTAVYWIEYVVRHGRKSLRSPIVDMPWYQSLWIDIYAFILLVLMAVYYLLKVIFIAIKRACCCKSTKQHNRKFKKN